MKSYGTSPYKQKGWEEGVRVLLSHGAKVFTKNQFGQTPLHYAACARSVECTRLLLQQEQDLAAVNHRDMRGRTPLHDASEQSSVDIIKMLLKAGAKIDTTDNDTETPLNKVKKLLHG